MRREAPLSPLHLFECRAGGSNSASFIVFPQASASNSSPIVTSTLNFSEWSGPVQSHRPVVRNAPPHRLQSLLQERLGVLPVGREFIAVEFKVGFCERKSRTVAAVKENKHEERFRRIRSYCWCWALLYQASSESDRPMKALGKGPFIQFFHRLSVSRPRELSLVQFFVSVVKKVRDGQLEHRISEKFHPLVMIRQARLICVRRMSQGFSEDLSS